MSHMSTVDVRDNPDASRYEAIVDGELAGFAAYRLRGTNIVFTHTEVHLQGQGVGSRLARGALDDVRRRGGLTVVPLCPFIKGWIQKHPEYADLT